MKLVLIPYTLDLYARRDDREGLILSDACHRCTVTVTRRAPSELDSLFAGNDHSVIEFASVVKRTGEERRG